MFHMQQKVLFKHCDPAGIVFFPRYFEMINDCVETFFDQALGMPFEILHVSNAVPTAQIQTRFQAPSRHGDVLELSLATNALGLTSWSYAVNAHCEGEVRFAAEATLVHVDAAGKPCPWPDPLRHKLSDYEASDDP